MAQYVPLLQIVGPVFIALISAVGAWMAARSKGQVDIQGTINSGFDTLTKKLESERNRLADLYEKRGTKIEELSARIDDCERRLSRQLAHIERLEDLLRENGLTPPKWPEGIAET